MRAEPLTLQSERQGGQEGSGAVGVSAEPEGHVLNQLVAGGIRQLSHNQSVNDAPEKTVTVCPRCLDRRRVSTTTAVTLTVSVSHTESDTVTDTHAVMHSQSTFKLST